MAEDKGKKEEDKAADAPAEGEVDAEAAAAAKKKKKKKLIIIVAALVVLLGVVGAVIALSGGKEDGKKDGEHAKGEGHELANDPCLHPASGGGDKKKEEAVDPCKPVYLDVPDLIVNLTSDSKRAHFVNLKLTLELKNADALPEVEENMPRIIDSFNIYLREMTKQDLEGTEGLIRLEEEMMLRINKIIKPNLVTDILFKSVIVQ